MEIRGGIIAGFISGFLTNLILHPLDLLKTRKQQRSKETLHHAWREHWTHGLYIDLLAGSVSWMIYFGIYESLIHLLSEIDYVDVHGISAGIAGIIVGVITNPLWVIKTRIYMNEAPETWSSLSSQDMVAGVNLTLLQNFVHGYLEYGCYHQTKNIFRNDSNMIILFSSSISKIYATTLTYPLQVMKTSQQNHSRNHPNKFRHFFQGYIETILKGVLGSGVRFLSYETVVRVISGS